MPIPKTASDVHGITDEVAHAPRFKQLSGDYAHIKTVTWPFNSDRFDIPLLAEEFMRAEVDFDLSRHKTIDVQTFSQMKHP